MSRQDLVDACDAYLAGVPSADGARMADMFTAEATVEDPIGSPIRQGRAAVEEFYSIPRSVTSIKRTSPVTVSGRTAAFQFAIELVLPRELEGKPPGSKVRLTITDILRFDEGGKIVSMIGIPDPYAGDF